jgi:hypothetical protein
LSQRLSVALSCLSILLLAAWNFFNQDLGTFSALAKVKDPSLLPVMPPAAFSIKHIVHQTYKSKDLPENYAEWRQHCIELNPD